MYFFSMIYELFSKYYTTFIYLMPFNIYIFFQNICLLKQAMLICRAIGVSYLQSGELPLTNIISLKPLNDILGRRKKRSKERKKKTRMIQALEVLQRKRSGKTKMKSNKKFNRAFHVALVQ